MSRHDPAVEGGLQEIVDALSARLGRPVLVDDVDLRPLAYSTQFGDLDAVRTESILGRTAPDAARESLFDHGIRSALEPVRTPAHPEIGMEARICIPILRGRRRLGFLWLIDDSAVSDEELALARAASIEAASVLQFEADTQLDRRRREQELLNALLGPDPGAAAAAASVLEADHYVPPRPLIVIVGSGAAVPDAIDRFRARIPVKHALCGELGGRAICVVSAQATMRGRQLVEALRSVVPEPGGTPRQDQPQVSGVPGRRATPHVEGTPRRDEGQVSGVPVRRPAAHVGEGDAVAELSQARSSYRRALAALEAAVDRGQELARWDELRAHRLLTALPPTAFDDLPAGLRKLLAGGHEQLVLTLETFLDHAGDVKSTAAELWLHRTSLYYRLRRIEEVASVDLNRGEDRLLCHVALRLSRLAKSA